MNTGYLQAKVAYKVAIPTGAPLDINGRPISESGLKQAIYLLVGMSNPDPALYVVEGYFNLKGFVTGNPTVEYSTEACPSGIIFTTPTNIVLITSGTKANFILYSSGPWEFVSGPAIATLSATSGGSGHSYLEITPNGTEGQGFFVFRNTVSGALAKMYVVNVEDPSVWILTTGFWDNLGFWFANGIWNF